MLNRTLKLSLNNKYINDEKDKNYTGKKRNRPL